MPRKANAGNKPAENKADQTPNTPAEEVKEEATPAAPTREELLALSPEELAAKLDAASDEERGVIEATLEETAKPAAEETKAEETAQAEPEAKETDAQREARERKEKLAAIKKAAKFESDTPCFGCQKKVGVFEIRGPWGMTLCLDCGFDWLMTTAEVADELEAKSLKDVAGAVPFRQS